MIKVFKALCDENRLRILNLLMDKELCVCEIETILDMTQSNVSRHLSKLKNAGLISASKDAQWVHYKLSDTFVSKNTDLIKYLRDQLKKSELYQKDIALLNNYYKYGFNCSDIRNNKENVIKTISNGG